MPIFLADLKFARDTFQTSRRRAIIGSIFATGVCELSVEVFSWSYILLAL